MCNPNDKFTDSEEFEPGYDENYDPDFDQALEDLDMQNIFNDTPATGWRDFN